MVNLRPYQETAVSADLAICPHCGGQFALPERAPHAGEAAPSDVPTGRVTITEYAVHDTCFAIHEKRDGGPHAPKSLRVTYDLGANRSQSEWICFEHTGFARSRAEAWWHAHSRAPVPATAAEACRLATASVLAQPSHITVRSVVGDDFERITDYRFAAPPPSHAAGDDRRKPPITAAMPSSIDDSEPPF